MSKEIRMDFEDFEMILEKKEEEGVVSGQADSFWHVIHWVNSGYKSQLGKHTDLEWSNLKKAIEKTEKEDNSE